MGAGILQRELQRRRRWGRWGRWRILLHGNFVDRCTGSRLDAVAWNLGNSA
jgi:hypothetical protein